MDLVVERVDLPGGPLELLRPADPDACAFEPVDSPDGVEELHPPHWARLWPSGLALARVLDVAPPDRPDVDRGPAAPNPAAPDHAAPDHAAPNRAAPDHAAPDHAAPNRAAPNRAAPNRAAPNRAAPNRAAPNRAAPNRTAPNRTAPNRTAPLARARVLELGCGLGLAALVAARAGARVLATDRSPAAVDLLRTNAVRSGLALDVVVSDWAAPAPEVLAGVPWELVVAGDVLYGDRPAALLAELLPRLVDAGGRVLLADPGRSATEAFLRTAADRWTVRTLAATPAAHVHELRPLS